MWYKSDKSGAVMDVTKVVEDAFSLAPQLQRAMIVSAVLELMQADEVIIADNEEEMLSMFENAVIVKESV